MKPKDEGKYIALPGAVKGEMVVRFPPEASGYLHIGHAKAALLNQHYKNQYEGKLIFRFDDTNPEKEKEDFEDVIRDDVSLLEIKPDRCTYTSDNFDVYLEKCLKLIECGKAYVDDTSAEVMKQEREQRVESKCRNNTIEQNMVMWQEMLNGTEKGQGCCVRAKIDMASDNGCLRDPTLYRCKKELHPRTGNKYNVYPTYDFACPIVDSIEGVTHALRTTEYTDRDAQYNWILDALEMKKPYIWAYSRLNMMNTVLSKRKLTWFVESNIVEGWDDPRMPTIRGVMRRGLTVEGLRQFIVEQGSSRSVVFMEWDKIWSFNKKIIDPIARRFMAVEVANAVVVNVNGAVDGGTIEAANHPKNPDLGSRKVKTGTKLLIDQSDAQLIKADDTVTFINWGNLKINKIIKSADNKIVISIDATLNLEDKNFKKTLKITWLEKSNVSKALITYYDHLIIKPVLAKTDDFKDFVNKNSKMEIEMYIEEDMNNLKKSEFIQILRKGYFVCDKPMDKSTIIHCGIPSPPVLVSVPDGSNDVNVFPVSVQKWKTENEKEGEKTDVKLSSNKVDATELNLEIKTCGDKIRELKAKKADKKIIQEYVEILKSLKSQYKSATGQDWTPESELKPVVVEIKSENSQNSDVAKLYADIIAQGDKIRIMKSEKKNKDELQPEIALLLKIKTEYKQLTGKDWVPPQSDTVIKAEKPKVNEPRNASKKDKESNADNKKSKAKKEERKDTVKDDGDKKGLKKQTRLGMEVKKSASMSDWYTEVITKSEMIEYYDVSGCYILRPWAYSIWEMIYRFFDDRIKKLGVKNCYFPMFVSGSALEKEKTHIADFAPEVAWVTKSGQSELTEPIAIRPTSETVMYPSFAKWVQSHRDLPIRINQWCNVVRWEFKNPTPFLRTREFLWQEGHSAFADKEAATAEVDTILEYYAEIYEELLAVPVIKGRKTEKEKFAGGDYTTTVEGYIAGNGRGVQGATSHHLGQNFSKMFEIVFEDPNEAGAKKYVYQNSWGLSTRSIGVMILVHGDDKGLVLPPNVASIQVIIVPCGITASTSDEEKMKLLDECNRFEKTLVAAGLRCESDTRDHYSPGWKYNHWELKGVPIRIELGPKDIVKGQFVAVRRDSGEKLTFDIPSGPESCNKLLDEIHNNLYSKAKKEMDDHLIVTLDWNEFVKKLDEKCIIMSPFCGGSECEEKIKKESAKEDPDDVSGPLMGAKSLCIPFEQPKPITDGVKCIYPSCQTKPQFYTLFGRSY